MTKKGAKKPRAKKASPKRSAKKTASGEVTIQKGPPEPPVQQPAQSQ